MSSQIEMSNAAHAPETVHRNLGAESLSLLRRLTPLSWCLIGASVGAPAVYAVASLEGVRAPVAQISQSVGDTLRGGVEMTSRAVAALAAPSNSAPAPKLSGGMPPDNPITATAKPAGAPCLALAASDNAPLINAVHTPTSVECLPAPALQQASLGGASVVSTLEAAPAAIRVVPIAAQRPLAPPSVPVSEAVPRAIVVNHARPVSILNKAAPVAPPDGMKAPAFTAQVEPAQELRPEAQLGVSSAAPGQQFNGPGAAQQKGSVNGKIQTAQLPGQLGGGRVGNRPPEQLPWLEADGTSRRSSLGRTDRGGSTGSVQILGKSVSTGAARWTEDLYKSR
jgi:hypothetical protein